MSDSRAPQSSTHSRWYLVWLGVMLGGMTLAAACARSQPLGNCINPADTTIVEANVTEERCNEICPSCTWESGN